MRFAHISDAHLGFTQYGTDERERDVYAAFGEAVSKAVEARVDFVVMAGDMFHTPTPGGTAIMHMADGLKRLKGAGIAAYFVLGEHDISQTVSHPVPFVYDKLGYAKYVGSGGPVLHDGVLIAGADKMRRSEVDAGRQRLAELDEAARRHDGHSVMVMHQGIAEAHSFASEMAASDLPRSFTYYAMGHLHDRYVKSFDFLRGPVVYPGSLEATSSDAKAGTEHGFYIVDLSHGDARPEWAAVETRAQYRGEVRAADLGREVERIAGEARGLERKPVVRIRIRGDADPEDVKKEMSKLDGLVMHKSWLVEAPGGGHEILAGRPEGTDEEMIRLAAGALGSERAARFAVSRLLGPLSEGRMDEAHAAIMEGYEDLRREGA